MGLTAAIITFQKRQVLLSLFLLCIILFTVLIPFDQYLCKLQVTAGITRRFFTAAAQPLCNGRQPLANQLGNTCTSYLCLPEVADWPQRLCYCACLQWRWTSLKNRHKKVSDSHNTYSLINCKTALNMMMMTVCAYERVDELAPTFSSTCRPVSNPSCRCYILCEQASAIHRHHWNKNNWLQWT